MPTINETIEQIKAERRNAWETTGKPLVDIMNTRALSGEEQQTWERVNADFDAAGARIAQLERAAEQERAFAAAPVEVVRGAADPEAGSATAELRSVLVDRTSDSTMLRFTEAEFTRALGSGTGAAGGNTIPTTFLSRLVEPLRDLSSVLQAGPEVIVTESGEDLKWPTVASHGAAVANVGESDTRAGTDPTFGTATLKAYEHSQLIVVPRRLVEDSAIDIEAFVARKIAENIGVSVALKLARGAGTTETAGIVTAATTGKTGATGVGGAPSFDDIIDLFYSVAAPYRANPKASFLVADQAFAGLRKLKNAVDGSYVWTPSVQVGQPDLILGKPAYADANFEYGLGKKSILFGDVSKYLVRFVGGVEVARSDHANFATNGVSFRGILRVDGLLTDASAVKAFAGGAS